MTDSPFQKWKNLKVLILGDLMIDRYLYGKVDRISPEAPVPILDLDHQNERLGGASNVALNIQALGAIPYLFGVIGHDANANNFIRLINNAKLDTHGIIQDSTRPTTVKTRILASSQQILRVDEETEDEININIQNQLYKRLESTILHKNPTVLILQDYNKGVLTETLIQKVIALAKQHHIKIIVDPKSKNFFSYKSVDLFKPNLKEIRDKLPFNISPSNLNDLKKAAAYINEKLGNQISMITLSKDGIYFKNQDEVFYSPASKKEIIDVCGAGDTVLSVAALGIAINLSIETIGTLANMAGGQVCGNIGVVPVDKNGLEQDYIDHLIKIGS